MGTCCLGEMVGKEKDIMWNLVDQPTSSDRKILIKKYKLRDIWRKVNWSRGLNMMEKNNGEEQILDN